MMGILRIYLNAETAESSKGVEYGTGHIINIEWEKEHQGLPKFSTGYVDFRGRPYANVTAKEAQIIVPFLIEKDLFSGVSECIRIEEDGVGETLPDVGTFSLGDAQIEINQRDIIHPVSGIVHAIAYAEGSDSLNVLSSALKDAKIHSCLHDHGDWTKEFSKELDEENPDGEESSEEKTQ